MAKNVMRRETNTVIIIVSIVVLVVLAVLGAGNKSVVEDKVFDADGFYQTGQVQSADPKKLYDSIYSNIALLTNTCRTDMSIEEQTVSVGNRGLVWIVGNSDEILNYQSKSENENANSRLAYLESLGNGSISGLYKNEQNILAPGAVKFRNRNVDLTTGGLAYIEVEVKDIGVIRWSPVKCWWCHIGRSDNNKHTTVYGAGSDKWTECNAGSIIGQAMEDTSVTFLKYNEEMDLVDCSAYEFYYDESNGEVY